MELEQLKYPIGNYKKPELINRALIDEWINDIESFPVRLKKVISKLNTDQLNWRYRPGGWTIKQVIHHCGDSHMNSFIRFKLALTEDNPTIKPYFEDRWANTPDAQSDDISFSLDLLTGLHAKWSILLKSFDKNDLEKTYFHPEHNKEFTIKETISIYSWHCNHHLAHIEQAITHKGEYDNVI